MLTRSSTATVTFANAFTLYTTDGDQTTFTRIEDPNQPLVGSWVLEEANGDVVVLVVLPGGHYMLADTWTGDATGFPGLEHGTYQWDPATGALQYQVIVDTNGDLGLSHDSGARLQLNGDTLVFSSDSDPGTAFTRVASSSSWFRRPSS